MASNKKKTLSDPFRTTDFALLLRFLETRYDVLCEYLAEEDDEASPYAFREIADELLGDLRECARWAPVPNHWRRLLGGIVKNARRMWEHDGADVEAVRKYVRGRTPEAHVELVLEEAYRDWPARVTQSDIEATDAPPLAPEAETVRPAPLPFAA